MSENQSDHPADIIGDSFNENDFVLTEGQRILLKIAIILISTLFVAGFVVGWSIAHLPNKVISSHLERTYIKSTGHGDFSILLQCTPGHVDFAYRVSDGSYVLAPQWEADSAIFAGAKVLAVATRKALQSDAVKAGVLGASVSEMTGSKLSVLRRSAFGNRKRSIKQVVISSVLIISSAGSYVLGHAIGELFVPGCRSAYLRRILSDRDGRNLLKYGILWDQFGEADEHKSASDKKKEEQLYANFSNEAFNAYLDTKWYPSDRMSVQDFRKVYELCKDARRRTNKRVCRRFI